MEDLPWLPQWLRGYLTDFLHALFDASVHRSRVAARLGELLERTGERRIVDLCSGSGGGLPAVRRGLEEDLGRPVTVVLTDKYPNLEAFRARAGDEPDRVSYVTESVDATDVPADLDGVRTLFSAFHHFPPEQAAGILRDAARARRGIAIFEVSERHPATFGAMLVMPWLVWLGTPFLRPFQWRRLAFTYGLPLVPLLVFWDGVVSCWRTYSTGELRRLADSVDVPGYRFEVGRDRVRGLPATTTYLIGYPTP